jgi:hypothetical protein
VHQPHARPFGRATSSPHRDETGTPLALVVLLKPAVARNTPKIASTPSA